MSNVIDINDKSTYPIELQRFCREKEDILKNTITKDFTLDYDTFLAKKIINIIKEDEIIAIHATRIFDIDDIYKKGLLIPSQSKKLPDIILKPLYGRVSKNEFESIKKALTNQIEASTKYNKLHFVVGRIDDVTIEKGFWMLNKYGGELLEDTFCHIQLRDFYFKNIAKIGNAYAIEFKVNITDLNKDFLMQIIAIMLEKIILLKNEHIFRESYIVKNIKAKDIMKAEKIISI